jgi:hypothetical protein
MKCITNKLKITTDKKKTYPRERQRLEFSKYTYQA